MPNYPGLPENPHLNRPFPSLAYTAMRSKITGAYSVSQLEQLRHHELLHRVTAGERALLLTGIVYHQTLLQQREKAAGNDETTAHE